MKKITKQIKAFYRTRVLECRMKAGISKQKDLATKTGIPASIISELESGKQFLSSPYALKISEVCGCMLDDLFERKTG